MYKIVDWCFLQEEFTGVDSIDEDWIIDACSALKMNRKKIFADRGLAGIIRKIKKNYSYFVIFYDGLTFKPEPLVLS